MHKSERENAVAGENLRRLIEEGQADADRGEVIDGDEAFEARRRSRTKRPYPNPDPGCAGHTQSSK